MRRKTLDVLLTAAGLVVVAVLLIAGGLLTWGHNFTTTRCVHSSRPSRSSSRPREVPASTQPAVKPYLEKYAGQQLMTGPQAKAFADHYIAVHLKESDWRQDLLPAECRGQAAPNDTSLPDRLRRPSRVRRCEACCSTPTPSTPWVGWP